MRFTGFSWFDEVSVAFITVVFFSRVSAFAVLLLFS